ncbi:hypothetical protein V2J09_005315 [Rumex salicifolius]
MGSPSVTCFAANSVLSLCSSSSPSMEPQPLVTTPTLYVCVAFSLLSLFFFVFFLTRRFLKPLWSEDDDLQSTLKLCLSKISEKTREVDPTRLPESLLVELLPSNSPKWDALFSSVQDPAVDGSGSGDLGGKRKKKRGKKKKDKQMILNSRDLNSEDGEKLRDEGEEELGLKKTNKEDFVCLYPFTSSSSATQRKIKQQYDQLVKSHDSKKLTLAEVGQFVNCLVNARTELQQKSEVIQRKYTIAKALLFRADRSSFDRLRKQLNKLELEQKRLEEDSFVYNWLQHQLKLSPAYKKMLDIGASMETKAKSAEVTEKNDSSFTEISFEEFLAQEKKDSFWQKRGKMRSSPT